MYTEDLRLRGDASKIDRMPIISNSCVEEKVNLFTTSLIELFDKHVPGWPVKLKHALSPWLLYNIRSLMTKKKLL